MESNENLCEDMNSIITEFLSTINFKNEVTDKYESKDDSLNVKVRKLESLVDYADEYERRNSVFISRSAIPTVSQGEICANVVTNCVKDKLRLDIFSKEINTDHRIGKKTIDQTPDRRSTIV